MPSILTSGDLDAENQGFFDDSEWLTDNDGVAQMDEEFGIGTDDADKWLEQFEQTADSVDETEIDTVLEDGSEEVVGTVDTEEAKDESELAAVLVENEFGQSTVEIVDTREHLDATDVWEHELKSKAILMQPEEQLTLCKMAQAGDTKAANLLTYSVYALVQNLAKKMGEKMFGYEDAVEIGLAAVAKAIHDYDETRTGRNGRTSKVSSYIAQHIRWAYLTEYRKRKKIRAHENQTLSPTGRNEHNDGRRGGDSKALEDKSAISPVTALIARNHKENMIALLEYLDERDANVTALRFGLHDDIVRTLGEVGKEVGLSGERVRQRLVVVLRIISQVLKNKGLMPLETGLSKMNNTPKRYRDTNFIRLATGQHETGTSHNHSEIAKYQETGNRTVHRKVLRNHEELLSVLGLMQSDHAVSLLNEDIDRVQIRRTQSSHHEITGKIDAENSGVIANALLDPEGKDSTTEHARALLVRMGADRDWLPRTRSEAMEVLGMDFDVFDAAERQAKIEAFYRIEQRDPKNSSARKIHLGILQYALTCRQSEAKEIASRIVSSENLDTLEPAFNTLPGEDQELLKFLTGFGTGNPQPIKECVEQFGGGEPAMRNRVLMALRKLHEALAVNPYKDSVVASLYEASRQKTPVAELEDVAEELPAKASLMADLDEMRKRSHVKEAALIMMRLGANDEDTVYSYKDIGEQTGTRKKAVQIEFERALFTLQRVRRSAELAKIRSEQKEIEAEVEKAATVEKSGGIHIIPSVVPSFADTIALGPDLT